MGQLRDQKIKRLNKPIYFFDAHFPPTMKNILVKDTSDESSISNISTPTNSSKYPCYSALLGRRKACLTKAAKILMRKDLRKTYHQCRLVIHSLCSGTK